MIAALNKLVGADPTRGWWRAGVGALAVVAPAFLLGQCAGANTVRQETRAAAARAAEANLAAHDTAADQRLADQGRVAQQTKELTDALSFAPDGEPDAARRALNCRRLRLAGTAPAGLPAGCGP